MNSIKYLRQIIDSEGHRPDPARSSTMNVTMLQSFLSLANDYNLHVSNMH